MVLSRAMVLPPGMSGVMNAERVLFGFEGALALNPSPTGEGICSVALFQFGGRMAAGSSCVGSIRRSSVGSRLELSARSSNLWPRPCSNYRTCVRVCQLFGKQKPPGGCREVRSTIRLLAVLPDR